MESSISSAALGFKLKCRNIYRDKFGYICATDKGTVRIQRPGRGRMGHDTERATKTADLIFRHEVKEFLHKNGLAVDRFLISSQGVPYYKIGEDCFVATPATSAPNANFADDAQFLAAVADVAKMHCLLRDFSASVQAPRGKKGIGSEKQIGDMQNLRRKLLKTGKFSDFDMLFLRGCEDLLPHVEKYASIPPQYLSEGNYICHNLLKEENIYNDGGKIILTNFSETSAAHYLFDLAYIIKRRIKAGADVMALDAILDVYLQHHPAKDFDIDVFHAVLMFPDKFAKVAADYYSKKRTFAPKTYIARMDECFRISGELLKYVNTLL